MGAMSTDDRFRTHEFVLWIAAVVCLLTVYSLADWGMGRFRASQAEARSLEGAALPDEVRVWTVQGASDRAWLFKRFYDTPERAEFDGATIQRLLGLEGEVDFWALWIFNFGTDEAFDIDRTALRVARIVGGVEQAEIAIGQLIADGGEVERPYALVSLAAFLGPIEGEGFRSEAIRIPARSARKLLVAFDGRVEGSAIESVRIAVGEGAVVLAPRAVRSRDLEKFLAGTSREGFPEGWR